MKPGFDRLVIRPITEDDSIEELTELLHRAYAGLAALGFRYFASHQTAEQTRSRLEKGEPFVGILNGKIVATVTLYTTAGPESPPHYHHDDVGYFGQFGVEPELQKCGIGRKMLRLVEERARELGLRELALDTAEGARHLVEWYEREGYRIVDRTSWSVTNYRSVIMSREL